MIDDDEILQDFLVEAGEILEQLSEQLVDLERAPEDAGLLNAIFRGFHTVKGGAGFLQLDPMVDLCHVAENVFDLLRKGECQLNADIMDTVLRALDSVNVMFDEVRSGSEQTPAEQDLLDTLQKIADGEPIAAEAPAPAAQVEPSAEQEPPAEQEPSAEQEPPAEQEPSAEQEPLAEQEPSASHEPSAEEPAAAEEAGGSNGGDLITDAEFEDLLDALQNQKSEEPSASQEPSASKEPAASKEPSVDEQASAADDHDLFDIGGDTSAKVASDEITEEEFEALLNELQEKGKGKNNSAEEKTASSAEPVKQEPVANQIPASETKPEPVPVEAKKAPAAAAKKAEAKESPVAAAEHPAKKPAAAPKAAPKQEVVGEATVRVDTRRLDEIMNMVGELVLVRNRLVRLGTSSQDEEWSKAVSNLDVVTADLQTSVMKTRMQPIKKVFGRFPRVVRDLARSLEKEISLELMGEETDLDKNLVEALADPLVHLVRNSVDHGIELPDDREQAGKARSGTIILSAEQEGDHILLTIDDDGKGMDPEALKQIAVNKGVIDRDTADRLSDSEAFGLIFAPGFSTKDVISDVSGRGVGMDVVKTKISQLNGTVDIQSEMGKGTRIAIKVPLTLAIMPTLMVMLADQTFALPLVSVNEIFHLNLKETNVVDGQEVIIVRDKAVPLYYLSRWLVPANESSCDDERHVVIVSVGNQRVGFVVDQLIGQEEVVIKALGKMLQGTDGMAGATITGDGTIALILDVPGMLKRYG